MSELTPHPGSLVLYKTHPARVKRTGKKLEIELEGAQTLSVRPKDVVLLHPGPLESLAELQPVVGEVETAWELLVGSTFSLAELAELAYGIYTPATAWAAWQLVAEGLYFYGTTQAIVARSPEEVAQEQASREAQAAEKRAWAAFLARVRVRQIGPEDGRYLGEVEDLALAKRPKSRVLRALGRAESPENAHAFLLELGSWDHRVNPHPQRLALPTTSNAAKIPELPAETRTDLTHLPAFAIDDEGNQEPDDALSLEGHRLWVHIADVAALVPPDSEADLEARSRGASLYLPEGTVDMLPQRAIHALGLGLAEISPALSFGLDLNANGEITGVETMPSWVRVTRLTYEEAEARLEEEPLQSLHRLAQIHQQRRQERGAVSIELPEVRIRVEGDKVIIRPLLPLRSRDLVTEAMLMAGEAIAGFAIKQQIPIPFTTQDPPRTEDRPGDLAGMYALRRASSPSQPSSTPGPHAGLGLEIYTQATSPLRRYLDLVVHQQLRARARGEGLMGLQDVLERVGATAAVSGSVRHAERLARKHWTLVYLMKHPGWQGEGILVEKRGKRGTVLLPALDLDAQVHLRQDLPPNSPLHLALSEVNLAELSAHWQVVD
ncbi:ribonuclease catalytic domain-containing protein [Chloroflexota bacterium]